VDPHEQTKDRPLSVALAEADAAYEDFVAGDPGAAGRRRHGDEKRVREAALADGHPYGHVGEHEPDVRRWLAGARKG
jgi:hypothetical protein